MRGWWKWWIFEGCTFGRGMGWTFRVGRVQLYRLSRMCSCFWKPWRDGEAVYWLRFAVEWLR